MIHLSPKGCDLPASGAHDPPVLGECDPPLSSQCPPRAPTWQLRDNWGLQCIVPIAQVLQPCSTHHPQERCTCHQPPRTAAGRAGRPPGKGGGGPMPTSHPSNWSAPVHCPHSTPSLLSPAPPSLPRAWSLFELGCSSTNFVIYTTSKLHSHFQLLHHSGHKNSSTN